jgi:hypothetical protein
VPYAVTQLCIIEFNSFDLCHLCPKTPFRLFTARVQIPSSAFIFILLIQ